MRRPSNLAFVFALSLALAAGCDAWKGARSATSSSPLCEVATSFPGSEEWPAALRDAVAAASVPVEAASGEDRRCNRLALESATFARQHALDAIDWRPWSQATLDEATALGRPLLVMSGFAASAACHDLARGELSSLRLVHDLNGSFVPVLVDREQRPDVDEWLMQAVEVQTGGAGWPAVVFLQGDARPFEAWSAGAASRDDKKLTRVVEDVTRRISLGGGTLGEHGDATAEKMQRRASVDMSGPLPSGDEVLAALGTDLASSFDRETGVFGAPPLFPRMPLVGELLRRDAATVEMATTALVKLRESPLADVAGGGFHRYAKAAGWTEPAWEKMLADNAAIAATYLDAAAVTGRAELRDTGLAGADFLLRELLLPSGAFGASLDATSTDAVGKPCDGCYYAISDDLRREALSSPEARARALRERETRKAPARDDAMLADANALAISALVKAAAASGQVRYLDAAVRAADVVDRTLRDGGRVRHGAWPDGRVSDDGYLADHALLALAYLDLDAAKAAGGRRWLDAAVAIADAMPARFEHEGTGGFFSTAKGSAGVPLRYKPALDGVVVSGNSAAATLYTRLAALRHDAADAAVARRTFEGFSKTLTLRPVVVPAMVTALLEWERLPEAGKGGK